ncbi:MAG: DNA repair protein RecO [Clostridiales bacterium]|nr:DNA repair protein RecO [Candidatus Crickella merdequi]
MLITTEGIVLKQRKIAGNRRIIVIFTKNYGKISAGTSINEKGKSKAALALRPFTYAEYDIFKGRESYSLNNAQAKRAYYSIGEDLDRFLVASKLIEYLDAILEEGQSRPKLFDMTIEFLESITNTNSNYETLLLAFVAKTLRLQGIMPEITCCADCGKKLADFQKEPGQKSPFFSVNAGGIVCEECVDREKSTGESLIFKPSFDIVSVLQYFNDNPISRFEKVALKSDIKNELKNIISRYVSFYLGTNVLDDDISL